MYWSRNTNGGNEIKLYKCQVEDRLQRFPWSRYEIRDRYNEHTTECDLKTTSEDFDFTAYLNEFLPDNKSEENLFCNETEIKWCSWIVGIIYLENNLEENLSWEALPNTGVHYNNISNFKDCINDDSALEDRLRISPTGQFAYGPIEIASFLRMEIHGKPMKEHFSRVQNSRTLRNCLAWRPIHIAPGYIHVMKEREQPFLTQQVFNQHMALIIIDDLDLIYMFNEEILYEFYHLIVSYKHVHTEHTYTVEMKYIRCALFIRGSVASVLSLVAEELLFVFHTGNSPIYTLRQKIMISIVESRVNSIRRKKPL